MKSRSWFGAKARGSTTRALHFLGSALVLGAVGCGSRHEQPEQSRRHADPQGPTEEVVGQTRAALTTTVFSETFDANAGGFTYFDDTFRGTSKPPYASGVRVASGGNPNGALQVSLGGIDATQVL